MLSAPATPGPQGRSPRGSPRGSPREEAGQIGVWWSPDDGGRDTPDSEDVDREFPLAKPLLSALDNISRSGGGQSPPKVRVTTFAFGEPDHEAEQDHPRNKQFDMLYPGRETRLPVTTPAEEEPTAPQINLTGVLPPRTLCIIRCSCSWRRIPIDDHRRNQTAIHSHLFDRGGGVVVAMTTTAGEGAAG